MASRGHRVTRVLIYVLLILFAVCFLFPFVWLVLSSFKSTQQIFTVPIRYFPHPIKFDNYPRALEYIPIAQYATNTIIVVVGATVGTVFMSAYTGYGFSKIRWRHREKVFFGVLATLMIPFQVVMIPLFVLFTRMKLTNTLLPLILPRLFDAFNIFLIRQYLLGMPDEIVEAAKIDGCTHFGIFFRIALPIIKPALVTVALFEINARWQDFMAPLVFLQNPKLYTMAVGLRAYTTLYGTEWDLLLAASVMFTLPMVVVFLFCQRQFIEGISTTGIKM